MNCRVRKDFAAGREGVARPGGVSRPLLLKLCATDRGGCGRDAELALRPGDVKGERSEGSDARGHLMEDHQKGEVSLQRGVPGTCADASAYRGMWRYQARSLNSAPVLAPQLNTAPAIEHFNQPTRI
jgi:hypothetical protein